MLAHSELGAGRAVLLVHAGVADSRMWSALVPRLAASHRVIACDLRGFGRTPLEPGRFSHAADLLALLDHLGVDRAAVVAASMGGAVALELALLAPDRVAALALLDAAIGGDVWSDEVAAYDEAEEAALEAGDVEAAVALTVRMWVDGRGRDADAVDPAARSLVAAMYRDAVARQLGVDAEEDELDPPAAARLGEIAVPALIVVGEHDVEDFARIARRLAASLPAAGPPVTVPGAAHLPAIERPGEVAGLLLAFLAEADRQPRRSGMTSA